MDNQQIFNDFTDFMNLLKIDSLNESEINNGMIINDNKQNSTDITLDKPENANKNTQTTKKSKCSICKVKINAVDAIISTCKCEKNYCLKHRMPESHNCDKIEEIREIQKKNLKTNLIKVESCKVSLI